jgi:hypothetical protein
MIAAAMWFNSGILLFADAETSGSGKARTDSHTIFSRQYGPQRGGASSVFVISEPGHRHDAAFHRCEEALAGIPPGDYSINQMRQTVQQCLADLDDDEIDFVALYSPKDQQYSLFRTARNILQEVVGYDCEGPAASAGHCLMHDRYNAARSMDSLDLNTVFSIAVETLDGIRAVHPTCGKGSEIVVMYADGHVSDVQHLVRDTPKKREAALAALGHT